MSHRSCGRRNADKREITDSENREVSEVKVLVNSKKFYTRGRVV